LITVSLHGKRGKCKLGVHLDEMYCLINSLIVELKGLTLVIIKPTIEHDPEPLPSTSYLLSHPCSHFPRDFSTKILYAFLVSPILAMCQPCKYIVTQDILQLSVVIPTPNLQAGGSPLVGYVQ
jgi:hypothetical protein